MQYTELRGKIYWFRRRAPEPLKPGMQIVLGDLSSVVGKNGYVRFSLGTNDRKEAAKLARKYAHLIDEAAEKRNQIERSRKAFQQPQSSDLALPTKEEIVYAAEAMYAMLLAADENTAEESLKSFLKEGDSDNFREPDRFVWSSADLPPMSTKGQFELLKLLRELIPFYILQSTGKFVTELTPDYLPFANAFRRYIAALEKRKSGDNVPTPDLPSKTSIWTWDDAFSYYLKQRPGLAHSSLINYRTAWDSLANYAKGTPEGLNISQVIAWRDDLLSKLHPQTVKSRLTFVSAIWRESRLNQKIDRKTPDPFEGLRVSVPRNAGTSRKEFSPEELLKIFSTPPLQTARAVSIHAGYWLPLLALYHGSRLEELTGIEVADIEFENQEILLHIRENTIRPRLKNRQSSERRFYVHPQIVELGFRDYVQTAKDAGIIPLFPSFARGDTFGEEFVTHVKKILSPVADGRLVGMHCFRHNFETARRNGRMDSSASNYITGRRIDSGSAALYGGPAGRLTLKEELSKINYGLDHSPSPAVTADELKTQDSARKRGLRS